MRFFKPILLLFFIVTAFAVASQANIGGSASALALASARGYGDRILPGIAAGLLGYAIGNYIGLVMANVMKYVI